MILINYNLLCTQKWQNGYILKMLCTRKQQNRYILNKLEIKNENKSIIEKQKK